MTIHRLIGHLGVNKYFKYQKMKLSACQKPFCVQKVLKMILKFINPLQ